MDQNRVKYLFSRYINGVATKEELTEFRELTEQEGSSEILMQLIDRHFREADGSVGMPEPAIESALAAILQNAPQQTPVRRLSNRRWPRWAAAAAVLVVAAGGAYYLLQQPASQNTAQRAPASLPAGQTVTLTLNNGEVVTLDSAGNEVIQQGNALVRKQGGQLLYESENNAAQVGYNTLATARGRQFRVTLPDGSKVWLNAASSIRYPTAFTGNSRKVELSGEAYFEIAPNPEQPFFVTTSHQEVQVLGTHFNVNDYDNESTAKTTLLSGSVKVVQPGNSGVVLKPGEQAAVAAGAASIPVKTVHVGDVMAWKNGFFQFHNNSISAVMRDLERWYDVDVQYQGKVPDVHYTGIIRRNSTLQEVINMLEQTGDVRFTIIKAQHNKSNRDIIQVTN